MGTAAGYLAAVTLRSSSTPELVPTAVRWSAIVYIVNGVGFGIGAIVTLLYFARNGELPMTPFGFRSLSGPFEKLDARTFSFLGWLFVGLCALDSVAGVWLWHNQRRGAWLATGTTPLALALGMGFALPFYLASIPMRLTLLLLGQRRTRRH